MLVKGATGDEPLSKPMMVRCVLGVPKFKHDTFGKHAFSVCGPLVWNSCQRKLVDAMELKHSGESHRLFVKFVSASTLAI